MIPEEVLIALHIGLLIFVLCLVIRNRKRPLTLKMQRVGTACFFASVISLALFLAVDTHFSARFITVEKTLYTELVDKKEIAIGGKTQFNETSFTTEGFTGALTSGKNGYLIYTDKLLNKRKIPFKSIVKIIKSSSPEIDKDSVQITKVLCRESSGMFSRPRVNYEITFGGDK